MMNKNIIVSGAHRSGTTWTGHVLSKSSKIKFIHEPFNPEVLEDKSPFKYWFEYINNNDIQKEKKIKKLLKSYYSAFDKRIFYDLLASKSYIDFKKNFSEIKERLTKSYLFKDPIALMSLEWIYRQFNWNVILLIRHPAAFIASLKIKNWEFDFNNFLNQKDLMNKYLFKYSDSIQVYSDKRQDIINQGILLWNILYYVVSIYREKYNEKWYFVKHEDLSKDPIKEFEKIFNFIQLPFEDIVQDFIIKTSKAKEKSVIKRNSAANIKEWKNRLSEREIQKIKEGTKEIWKKYYNEEDW